MATAVETKVVQDEALREAERHNALIKQRYELLKSASEDQINESVSSVDQNVTRAYSATLTPERPVYTPTAPTYTHTRVDSPIFTPETLDKTIGATATMVSPVEVAAPQAVETPATVQATFSLTRFAFAAMAAVVMVVALMLAAIGALSNISMQNSIKIRQLEDRKADLQAQISEVEEQIADVRSEEYIKAWAKENGFVFED